MRMRSIIIDGKKYYKQRPSKWTKERWLLYKEDLYERGILKRTPNKNHGYTIISKHTIDEVKAFETLSPRVKNLLILLGYNRKCVICGIKGTHFAKGLDIQNNIHIDFYADDETMITIDHIVPVSKGGPKKDINNMQLMCKICNELKGNTI